MIVKLSGEADFRCVCLDCECELVGESEWVGKAGLRDR